jgi:hypothetical protein
MSSNATVIQLEDLELIDEPLRGTYAFHTNNYKVSATEENEGLVSFGEHSFLKGMMEAYKKHKSITLSPDIIWLLILQGFSYHVAANKEKLRSMFVSFDDKKELVVTRLNLTPDTANEQDWMGIIDEFVEKISEHTGKELTDTLEPKFTTTTPVSHTAGMVSIMSAMKHYFDYRVIMCVCGFPSITIEGTLEDWELIKKKIEGLTKYDLDWWTSKMIPVINEFINAKKGIINKSFWLKALRKKDSHGCYDPSYISGWLCVFFPYDKYGERLSLNTIDDDGSDLPSELLDVPFILQLIGVGEFNCELHSGFVGIKETKTAYGVYNVKPVIGWGFMFNVNKEKDNQ